MNYTLQQLTIYLQVVRSGSITKAAEVLHLTQPAVSMQLKNFQLQFEIPLTEIVGKQIYITAFGKQIAAIAEGILEQAEKIKYQSLAYKGQLFGTLKLAVVSTGKYVMPYFLTEFMRKNSAVQLNMEVTNKSIVVQSLEQNQVDFALVSVLPKQLKLEKIDLLQNKLYLVGSTVLAKQWKKNEANQLQHLPLLFREQGSATRQTMEAFIKKRHLVYNSKIELTSNEAVKQALLAGLGFSIMPLIGIRNELLHGELQIIPYKGLPIKTTWSLVWLKGKQHSPVATAFLKHLRAEKQKIVQQKFSWYEEY